jgi:inner membrane protein
MTYKTHVALAMSVAIPTVYFVNINGFYKISFLFLVAIGALAPDLDEEGSYLSRKLPVMPMLFFLFGVTHRGVTHRAVSLLFLSLVLGALTFIDQDYEAHKYAYYGFIFGYAMHLLGDMMTKGGIRDFFYPISDIKAVLLPREYRFYTGSVQEYLVFFAIMLTITIELYAYRAYFFKGMAIGIF